MNLNPDPELWSNLDSDPGLLENSFQKTYFFLTIRIGSVAEPEPIKFLFYFLFLFELEAEAIFWIGSVSFFLASEKLND